MCPMRSIQQDNNHSFILPSKVRRAQMNVYTTPDRVYIRPSIYSRREAEGNELEAILYSIIQKYCHRLIRDCLHTIDVLLSVDSSEPA